ncbi:hypothetical protein MUY14_09425 [Amycolatopsis sp. FBCC-B4732]|uniref:hypothetical protein n=1 Tax=Amycolatopsis sp. FBCC-B4732 TaxID=3079339 RepID=UPI001FF5AA26|nr:hypothetical protein [Amycolatopsis sp. FBCC-B4732]UOX90825.1 hypothetical protein MUY14_09425 [Amycolatopsis sp. FBCC-B4732]
MKIGKTGESIVLELLGSQRAAVMVAADVVGELRVPDLVVEVRFGASRQQLVDIAARVTEAESLVVGVVELQAVYRLLRSLPDCFGSEEAFHIRTGYFTEDFLTLAKGLMNGISQLPD